uniref:SHC binding and spindle associated 1 n=1 Tax=Leptobrachium leishanense TaxID=445787 RepID=A0A8C5PN27_9ANUR
MWWVSPGQSRRGYRQSVSCAARAVIGWSLVAVCPLAGMAGILDEEIPVGGEGGKPGVTTEQSPEDRLDVRQALFQEEYDSASDYGSYKRLGKAMPHFISPGNMLFPDLFQTNNLLFYERFEAYKDYLLGDAKPSEVKDFIAEYVEKAIEPQGWKAVWHTDIFDVLVEVTDVRHSELKVVAVPCEPFLCESRVSDLTREGITDLLEVKEQKVPLQELFVVYDDSGEFDQTALVVEHVRFFYQHVWRPWDEEEEDHMDYFVRCCEPRLRLHYDILEDRIPSGLVSEHRKILSESEEVYTHFNNLRNSLSSKDSDCELDNVSMVEGMKMDEKMENLKRKLKLIENPLLRYLFCYQRNSGSYNIKAKGPRPSGGKVIHVVSTTMSVSTLQCLTAERLEPEAGNRNLELQFHGDPLEAVNACYEGDLVIICPGRYVVYGLISIVDSIELEGYGLPDDVVIEKRGKGDHFVDCTGAQVKISNVKFVQHEAVEGILTVHSGKTELDNCVLQCETTGVTVKKSAELLMKYCDLYGAKDFIDVVYDLPKMVMENNIIHNNEGYAVVLVKPGASSEEDSVDPDDRGGEPLDVKIKEDEAKINPIPPLLTSPTDQEITVPERGECSDTNEENETEGNVAIASGECPPNPTTIDKEAESNITEDNVQYEPPVENEAAGNVIAEDDFHYEPPAMNEETEGNDTIAYELIANSRRKRAKNKKRLSTLGITDVDEDKLATQEMFMSIVGNHFKRNGKGSFGTFLF